MSEKRDNSDPRNGEWQPYIVKGKSMDDDAKKRADLSKKMYEKIAAKTNCPLCKYVSTIQMVRHIATELGDEIDDEKVSNVLAKIRSMILENHTDPAPTMLAVADIELTASETAIMVLTAQLFDHLATLAAKIAMAKQSADTSGIAIMMTDSSVKCLLNEEEPDFTPTKGCDHGPEDVDKLNQILKRMGNKRPEDPEVN